MESMHVLIITGLSGAGKSLALRHLEDLGFFCVDNLPSVMIKQFLSLCEQASPPILRVALVVDSREYVLGSDWNILFQNVAKAVGQFEILFLECRDAVLQRRYHETRRRHPLDAKGDIEAGIKKERALIEPLKKSAHFIIDTSDFKPLELFQALEHVLHIDVPKLLTLRFMSFGYKNGVPQDADFVFDTRFLLNPFYEPPLRSLSGLDQAVRDFIFSQPNAARFYTDVECMLRRLLPELASKSKQRVVVAFGCTGGRHRSVVSAEEMARRFQADVFQVNVLHRDLMHEGDEIRARFQAHQSTREG